MLYNKYSISHILIALSIIFTGLSLIYSDIYVLWMNTFFLEQWKYHIYVLQFFSSQFLHWWILHLFMNSVFIYYFGNIVETMLGRKKYILFFIFISIFNGLVLTFFNPFTNTVWISGFALAIITYYTLELRAQKNPEYTGWITAIIINIWLWFAPWISLIWHMFWAIGGAIFYALHRKIWKK